MNKEHEKKTEQTNSQLVKDLAYIKQLMELQTRNTAAGASPYFIIWGIIWIIGFGADALVFDHLLPWIWGGLSIIGMILNLTIGIKQAKEDPLPTVFDRKLSMLFSCFGVIVVLFIVLITTGFVHFSADVIGLYSVIFVSILYLLIGVILGKEVFIMGIWFALLACINAIWFPPYHAGIMTVFGGGIFLITGIMLRRWGKNDG